MTNYEWLMKEKIKASDINMFASLEFTNATVLTVKNQIVHQMDGFIDELSHNAVLHEFYEWLGREHKPQILDDKESQYLKNVLRPFKNKVARIEKVSPVYVDEECIIVYFKDMTKYTFPRFKKGTMYKKMKSGFQYSPIELGLWEQVDDER